MTASALSAIKETKNQFLFLVTGEYLITGFFWVFAALGSLALHMNDKDPVTMFFITFFIFMLSNGIWEILTGWYADKFKRQISLSAGFAACLVGFCFMGAAALVPQGGDVAYFAWGAGITIWSLGPALLSGAQEAWLVDRCNFFSKAPPEDVDDTFKTSAGYGVLAKAVGAAACFFIFSIWANIHPTSNQNNGPADDSHNILAFVLSAIIAAVISAGLLYRSLKLREEYWAHPKYQTKESLFAFLGKGLQELWRPPYRWFTIAYVGLMCLNYVQSPTVWPYIQEHSHNDKALLVRWGISLIAADFTGSLLSRPFSKWIDRIKQHWLRLPVASLAYLVPILLLWIFKRADLFDSGFLYLLVVASFLFRTAHASVFGSLNTIGQLAIKSDERRAILISMSSAISSFVISMIFFAFYWSVRLTYSNTETSVTRPIEWFWLLVPLPFILILALGGYLVARPGKEAN
jgi:MFS family permease